MSRPDPHCEHCHGTGILWIDYKLTVPCLACQPDYYNKPKQQETKGMNYSTAVMLINTNIRAVKCSYEPDTKDSNGKITKTYDRVIYKTLDQNIKVGDFVVVPTDTRHCLTVVKVEETDVDVDFDSTIEIKWIISQVDKTAADKILEEETKWIDALKKSEKRHKREEIKKKMLDFYTDKDATALPIAHMGDVQAIEDAADKK